MLVSMLWLIPYATQYSHFSCTCLVNRSFRSFSQPARKVLVPCLQRCLQPGPLSEMATSVLQCPQVSRHFLFFFLISLVVEVYPASPCLFLPTGRMPPPCLPACSGAIELGQEKHCWDPASPYLHRSYCSFPSPVSRDGVMCFILYVEWKVLVGASSEPSLPGKTTSGFNKPWLPAMLSLQWESIVRYGTSGLSFITQGKTVIVC